MVNSSIYIINERSRMLDSNDVISSISSAVELYHEVVRYVSPIGILIMLISYIILRFVLPDVPVLDGTIIFINIGLSGGLIYMMFIELVVSRIRTSMIMRLIEVFRISAVHFFIFVISRSSYLKTDLCHRCRCWGGNRNAGWNRNAGVT